MIYERKTDYEKKYSLNYFKKQWHINLTCDSPHCVEYYYDAWSVYKPEKSWYEVETEILDWLENNCKSDVYITYNCNSYRNVYYFRDKPDAMLFKLRWK